MQEVGVVGETGCSVVGTSGSSGGWERLAVVAAGGREWRKRRRLTLGFGRDEREGNGLGEGERWIYDFCPLLRREVK
jgi:hypothetical protein